MDVGFLLFVQNHLADVGWKKVVCGKLKPRIQLYSVCVFVFVNVIDPSAGSPTETLLRLLLPRNVQI